MATNLKQVKRGYANLKRSGTQMYYETMGSGDPVIFVHQCWWNNFEFEGVIPMVAKQYTVYSPDSLGFGFSPAAPNWFEFTDFTDSFIDFMDDLGIEKASFVGPALRLAHHGGPGGAVSRAGGQAHLRRSGHI